jgi:hypothetical protein
MKPRPTTNVVLLLASLLTGCQALHVYPQHPSVRFRDKALHMPESLRAGIQTVAVVPLGAEPLVQATGPDYGKKGGEVGQGAKEFVAGTLSEVSSDDSGMGLLLLPFLLPIMAGAGAAAGAAKANRRENNKATTDALLDTYGQALPNERLAQAVATLIDESAGYEAAPQGVAADAELRVGVSLIEAVVDDTSQTRFTVYVDAELVAPASGRSLFTQGYVYRKALPLRRWAKDDGAGLAMYLDGARHRIAQQVVASVFTRLELRHVLRPVATADHDGEDRAKTKTLTPRLAWEFVTLGGDDHLPAPVQIDEGSITYDLEIYDDERLVYRQHDLPDPAHLIAQPLEPCRTLTWTVRPSFRVDPGLQRVGEWMQRPPQPGETPQLFYEGAGEERVLPPDLFPTLRTPCSRS